MAGAEGGTAEGGNRPMAAIAQKKFKKHGACPSEVQTRPAP